MLHGIDSMARQMTKQWKGRHPTVLTVRKARASLPEVKHRRRLMVAKEATRRALIPHLWQGVEEGSRRESSAILRRVLYGHAGSCYKVLLDIVYEFSVLRRDGFDA